MIYTYIFPEPSIASREKEVGRGPPEGNGKIRAHISRARIKEMKGNKGHHNVPEIGGQVGKGGGGSFLERGGYYVYKPVRAFVSFPEIGVSRDREDA